MDCDGCVHDIYEYDTGAWYCELDLEPDGCSHSLTQQDVDDEKAERRYNHKADLEGEREL